MVADPPTAGDKEVEPGGKQETVRKEEEKEKEKAAAVHSHVEGEAVENQDGAAGEKDAFLPSDR